MYKKIFSKKGKWTIKNVIGLPAKNHFVRIALVLCLVLSPPIYFGCQKSSSPTSPADDKTSVFTFESTGEEFLISALDEVESIADYALRAGKVTNGKLDLNTISSSLPSKDKKQLISAVQTDTTYIYGEVTSEGYCAVVTERHTYPKGILLITVRKSYGKPPTKIVTETKRYITYQDFIKDTSQQSNITELYGLSSDTLVTHVTRNGVVETYTFRLPVITRVTNPVDGSVRVTTRYGAAGTVRSEIRDGNGNLIQFRQTYGEEEGGIVTYTEFPDGSWRNVRSIGQANGSILREITSGP